MAFTKVDRPHLIKEIINKTQNLIMQLLSQIKHKEKDIHITTQKEINSNKISNKIY